MRGEAAVERGRIGDASQIEEKGSTSLRAAAVLAPSSRLGSSKTDEPAIGWGSLGLEHIDFERVRSPRSRKYRHRQAFLEGLNILQRRILAHSTCNLPRMFATRRT